MSTPPPSPWLAELGNVERAEPLRGDLEVDVAVVGAGYTGLSAALSLRAEGLSVAVLEAHYAGFGASGRNAGHLGATIGKDLPTSFRLYGRERTRALVELAHRAIEHTEGLIERHAIACHYERVGGLGAAVAERQHAKLDAIARACEALGLPGEILDAADLRKRGLPRAFTRGFYEPSGGILQPAAYLRGLRDAALAAGVLLFEDSPVEQLEDGARPTVHVREGHVRARDVVLATNAWTPGLGFLRSQVLPLHVQLFTTEPLAPEQREAVGWPGREGVYTCHETLENWRWTHDHRILGGTKTVRYGYGGRHLPDVDPRVSARLEALFRERFPELTDVRIAHHWGGPIAMSLDFLPRVGRTTKSGRIVHAASYGGHGLAMASYAGEMVRDLVLGRDGPGRALWERRGVPLLPEPLRWLGLRGLTRVLDALDARVDRAARARP